MTALAERYPQIIPYQEDRWDFPKVQGDCFVRAKSKMLRYYFEALEQKQLDREDRILIANRCFFDYAVYSRSYAALGWLAPSKLRYLEELAGRMFEEKPQHVVIYNPPLETLRERIQRRWKATGIKKWREEDFGYLEVVQHEFATLYERNIIPDALYLTHQNVDENVEAIARWLALTEEPALEVAL